MGSFLPYILMLVGTALAAVFLIFLFIGNKYSRMIAPLNNKEFPLCELYGVGFVMLEIMHYKYSGRGERRRKQEIALIYGEKHAEYYLRVNAAERMTFTFLLVVLGFALYGISGEWVMLVIFLAFAALAYYYISTLPKTTLEKKTNKILDDFADVVSKLALLVNAGMIMREAWEKVAYTGDSELYQEMQLVCINMANGMSETDAYAAFGTRCVSPEIKKFTSTIIQGLVKGNAELVEMIKQQSREIWDVKRHRVRQQGEKAASKLMIPICVMFIGIIIIIVVPIFANLGM